MKIWRASTDHDKRYFDATAHGADTWAAAWQDNAGNDDAGKLFG